MTTLERLSFLNELKKRSETGSLTPEQQLEYKMLLAQRRQRVKEMTTAGQVVDGSTSQFNAIQRRTKAVKVVEEDQD